MMLAHIINRFVEKSQYIYRMRDKQGKCSIAYLWKRLWSFSTECDINEIEYEQLVKKRSLSPKEILRSKLMETIM